MKAHPLAKRIQKTGKPVLSILEPQEHQDGLVLISEQVHVQVPFQGSDPNVVRVAPNGELVFGDPQTDFFVLLQDIEQAIIDAQNKMPAPDEE